MKDPNASTTSKTPPSGIPPLVPNETALSAALGGPPLPVPQIGRPVIIPRLPGTAPAGPPVDATFAPGSGVSPADREAVANIRSGFHEIITALRKSTALVARVDALEGPPELLAGSLNFDPATARAFGIKCSELLASITPAS